MSRSSGQSDVQLVDGLTVHLLLDPTEIAPGRVRSILVTHLNDLGAAPIVYT